MEIEPEQSIALPCAGQSQDFGLYSTHDGHSCAVFQYEHRQLERRGDETTERARAKCASGLRDVSSRGFEGLSWLERDRCV